MDLLLDTNVVIDHFGARPGFDTDAHKVFATGLFGDATLWVTPNSLRDAFYILRKTVSPADIQAAFTRSFSCVHVCSVCQEDIERAASLSWQDMEDCMISVCAEKVHADYIVTRDANGFSASPIKTISPAELLKKMAEQQNIHYDFIDSF